MNQQSIRSIRRAMRNALAGIALTGGLFATPAAMAGGIPVYDALNFGLQGMLNNLMEQQVAEGAIKSYLGDNIITETLGKKTIQEYLGDKTIKGYLGDTVITKMLGQGSIENVLGKEIIGKVNQSVNQAVNSKLLDEQADGTSGNFNTLQTKAPDLLDESKRQQTFKQYEADTSSFYGNDTTPNCPKNGSSELIDNCVKARNIMAAQLKEIQNISKTLESRNKMLQEMSKNDDFATQTELQQKQYKMLSLQTIIANDNMRLQASLAAYNNMRSVYQEKYNEALQNRISGKSDFLSSLGKGLVAEGGMVAGKAAANELISTNIFTGKKR